MNITPITDTNPACFGAQCPKRAECNRYAAVEGTCWSNTLPTCDDGQGGRPMFVALANIQTTTQAAEC